MPVLKAKKEPWFAIKIKELEQQLEEVENTNTDINMDSYCKGFYDCMSKYAIFAKAARKRIVHTIKERYKGDGETRYVWKVK